MKALLICYVCDSTTLQQRLCPRVWYVSNHWRNSHCGKKTKPRRVSVFWFTNTQEGKQDLFPGITQLFL